MNSEFQPRVAQMDPTDTELQAMLAGALPPADQAPEGLSQLTEANIDAEIAAMFGSVSEEDVALIGAADGVAARSLIGSLTANEQAELQAADERAVTVARSYFAAAQEKSIGDAIDAMFGDDEEDADEPGLVGAARR